jgi:SPP1 family predicted phage head-tail adaptor
MGAGSYNRRVRIERRIRDSDRESNDWQLVLTAHARVIMQSGKEIIAADAPISMIKASIWVRYSKRNCTNICEGMRLTVGGLAMRIEQVRPDVARREYVQLICVGDVR